MHQELRHFPHKGFKNVTVFHRWAGSGCKFKINPSWLHAWPSKRLFIKHFFSISMSITFLQNGFKYKTYTTLIYQRAFVLLQLLLTVFLFFSAAFVSLTSSLLLSCPFSIILSPFRLLLLLLEIESRKEIKKIDIDKRQMV